MKCKQRVQLILTVITLPMLVMFLFEIRATMDVISPKIYDGPGETDESKDNITPCTDPPCFIERFSRQSLSKENVTSLNRKNIVIVTTWRSGSTFLEELFGSAPGAWEVIIKRASMLRILTKSPDATRCTNR